MSTSNSIFLCTISILLIVVKSATGCYTSIFSFGDSLSDNGNLAALSAPKIIHQSRLPNGETYFGHPTGRCCDGRLIVDLIAQNFGLPIPPPYLGIKEANSSDFYTGVNFAVGGATVQDLSFFDEGLSGTDVNVTLRVELDWFKDFLPRLCGTKADCMEFLKNSLIVMGEIGGDDYNHPLLTGRSFEEVKTFVPPVVDGISTAIIDMIELGAVNFIVPGNLPIGCSTIYLDFFKNSSKHSDYDKATGCINWLNNFAMHHNKLLQIELNRIRDLYPHATIIYADIYNSAMRFYRSPKEFGFTGEVDSPCCGVDGHYDSSVHCGDPPTTSCADPSAYANWDGLHLTEAANRWIVEGLFEGPYSIPPISLICSSVPTGLGLSHED